MKKLLFAAAALAALCSPALAMTEAECAAQWTQADADANGTLNGVEAERYGAFMRSAGKDVSADGTFTQSVFLDNCKADVFATAATDERAPLAGANSFTEDQAKDRAIGAGYVSVSALTKDADGIWRGTAMKDGKSGNIAVDFKGNVVAN